MAILKYIFVTITMYREHYKKMGSPTTRAFPEFSFTEDGMKKFTPARTAYVILQCMTAYLAFYFELFE
jgi:hypothetical protein